MVTDYMKSELREWAQSHVNEFPVAAGQIIAVLNEHTKLLRVAMSARKWQKATPGEDSVNAESELMANLDALKAEGIEPNENSHL